MTCCPPIIVPFYNVSTSAIGYGAEQRRMHGEVPQVQVTYYDPEADEYVLSNSTRIALTGNPVDQINIDHGGPNTGVIRIV